MTTSPAIISFVSVSNDNLLILCTRTTGYGSRSSAVSGAGTSAIGSEIAVAANMTVLLPAQDSAVSLRLRTSVTATNCL